MYHLPVETTVYYSGISISRSVNVSSSIVLREFPEHEDGSFRYDDASYSIVYRYPTAEVIIKNTNPDWEQIDRTFIELVNFASLTLGERLVRSDPDMKILSKELMAFDDLHMAGAHIIATLSAYDQIPEIPKMFSDDGVDSFDGGLQILEDLGIKSEFCETSPIIKPMDSIEVLQQLCGISPNDLLIEFNRTAFDGMFA
jgi:hypothetical protein